MFPRAARYVSSLPQGLESYPECKTRIDPADTVLGDFPDLLDRDGIPAQTRRALTPPKKSEWMSDVASVALRLLARDVVFADDASYLKFGHDAATRIFRKPIHRMLTYVLSPTLLLMGASRRWSAFRVGSELTAEIGRRDAELYLTFPNSLYPPLILQSFGETFRAVVIAARAKDPRVALTQNDETSAHWELRW